MPKGRTYPCSQYLLVCRFILAFFVLISSCVRVKYLCWCAPSPEVICFNPWSSVRFKHYSDGLNFVLNLSSSSLHTNTRHRATCKHKRLLGSTDICFCDTFSVQESHRSLLTGFPLWKDHTSPYKDQLGICPSINLTLDHIQSHFSFVQEARTCCT